MQTLQVFGGLVLGVPVAVVREGQRLAPDMTPHIAGPTRALVDVVAHEHHQVEVLRGQVPMRTVETVLEVLTGTQAEAQPARVVADSRRRPRATDRTHLAARKEPIEVPTRRLQTTHLDVHAERARGPRRGRAAPHNPCEPLVVGDLPADAHRVKPGAPAAEGLRRQPRPQHHTVGKRGTRCHAEREGVAREPRALDNATGIASRTQRYRPPPTLIPAADVTGPAMSWSAFALRRIAALVAGNTVAADDCPCRAKRNRARGTGVLLAGGTSSALRVIPVSRGALNGLPDVGPDSVRGPTGGVGDREAMKFFSAVMTETGNPGV